MIRTPQTSSVCRPRRSLFRSLPARSARAALVRNGIRLFLLALLRPFAPRGLVRVAMGRVTLQEVATQTNHPSRTPNRGELHECSSRRPRFPSRAWDPTLRR